MEIDAQSSSNSDANECTDTETETIIRLTPEQQLEFWQKLQEPVELTPQQVKLGRIMRGEI